MKVLIVIPPLTRFNEEGITVKRPWTEIFRIVTPIDPLYAATILDKHEHKVNIFDMGLYKKQRYTRLKTKIKQFRPDYLIVMSAILTFVPSQDWDAKEVFDLAGRKTIKILTGSYATNYPEESLKVCDYVVIGEPENAILHIIEDKPEKGIIGPLPVNINELPLPNFKFIDERKYYKFSEVGKARYPEKSKKWRDIMVSRGCVNRCPFCCLHHLRGKQPYRRRDLVKVMKEIQQALVQGVEEIHFFDDLFAANERQVLDFCNRLKELDLKFPWLIAQGMHVKPLTYESLKAMKETGMYRLIVSFESGNDRVLNELIHKNIKVTDCKNIIKWCHDLDIELVAMFVIGMPGETREELMDTVKLAEDDRIDYSIFSVATPMVGSELAKIMEDKFKVTNIIRKTVGMYETEEFNEVDLGVIRAFDWNRINFSTPEKIEKYKKMFGLDDDTYELVRKYSYDIFYHYFPDYNGPKTIFELDKKYSDTVTKKEI